MDTVSFIGLGRMGLPMAYNLAKSNYKVRGYDISSAVYETMDCEKIEPCTSLKACLSGADVVISMLPACQYVLDLYLGTQDKKGILEQLSPTTLIIDSSTVSRDTAIRVAKSAEEKQIACIDAPVSGGMIGAEQGTLSFMCGGSSDAVQRAEPILLSMGKKVFHAGEAGSGQMAKICNNMLLAICMVGTSEALQLGIDAGLDPKILSNIMKESSGGNWSLEKYNPCPNVMPDVPSSKNYQTGFMVDLMAKDLNLAMHAGVKSSSTTPLGMLARSLYQQHARQGFGQKDFSSIFKLFQKEL